jgi:hypothetical protein
MKMEKFSDCKCHNAYCTEIGGARLKTSLTIDGEIDRVEVLPTTVSECEIRKEQCKKAGEFVIKRAAYNTINGLDED